MAAALIIPTAKGFDIVPPHTACGGTLETQILEMITLLEDHEAAKTEEERTTIDAMIRERVVGSKQKVDAINGVLAELDAREQACAKEIARLQARKQTAANNAKRLRSYVVAVCAGAGLKKLEGLTSGFSIRNNTPQLEIFNEEELPAQYIQITIEERHTPDTQRIKTDLLNGAEIPGAQLKQSQSAVRR